MAFFLGIGFGEAKASSTVPLISDDEIQGFLFQIPEAFQEKVQVLGPDPARRLSVPVLFGSTPTRIIDSWGETRSGGRVHKGIDILAPRGTFVVSPTDAFITDVGYDDLGGNYVLSANPGGEQFYYAHLLDIAPDVAPGTMLRRGDLIGYVGNTGNARRSPSHLHFGIYYKGIPTNPYPRFTRVFSLEEKAAILENIAGEPGISFSVAFRVVFGYQDFLQKAQTAGLVFPNTVAWVLEHSDVLAKARMFDGALIPGSEHDGVRFLQEFLIRETGPATVGSRSSWGPAARALAEAGATGYFGTLTQNALREYQAANGIIPAEGYFDPLTKAHVLDTLSRNVPPETITRASTEEADIISKSDKVTPLFKQVFHEVRSYLLLTQVLPDSEGTGKNREREGEGKLIQDEIPPA